MPAKHPTTKPRHAGNLGLGALILVLMAVPFRSESDYDLALSAYTKFLWPLAPLVVLPILVISGLTIAGYDDDRQIGPHPFQTIRAVLGVIPFVTVVFAAMSDNGIGLGAGFFLLFITTAAYGVLNAAWQNIPFLTDEGAANWRPPGRPVAQQWAQPHAGAPQPPPAGQQSAPPPPPVGQPAPPPGSGAGHEPESHLGTATADAGRAASDAAVAEREAGPVRPAVDPPGSLEPEPGMQDGEDPTETLEQASTVLLDSDPKWVALRADAAASDGTVLVPGRWYWTTGTHGAVTTVVLGDGTPVTADLTGKVLETRAAE